MEMQKINFSEIYDLSVLVTSHMVRHPAIAKSGGHTILSMINSPEDSPPRPKQAVGWPVCFNIEMSSHDGTHVDAPLHANKDGKTIDELPLDTFMGTGVVLDMRNKGPSEGITPEDLKNATPAINEGDIVIVNTGWHEKWGETEEYLDEHPGLTEEAVYYLVEKKVKMVGMDTICPEVGSEESHWPHPVHRVFLIENEIPLIEVLGGDINKVTGKRCFIVAFPIKMTADAAPARVLAFV